MLKYDVSIDLWVYFFLCVDVQLSCSHLSQPSKDRPRVGLILGAGGARALSAIGVLKVLKEHQIPIDYLVGMGWGAWVAGVYAKNQSINEVHWSFYKLSKRGVFGASFFKNPFQPKSMNLLEQDLKENFELVSPAQIPFACPSLTRKGQWVWQTEKLLKLSVKRCLTVPPFFKLESNTFGSLFSVEKAFYFLKDKKMDIIIWVHPLQGGDLFPKKFSNDVSFFVWTTGRSALSNISKILDIQQVSPHLQNFYLHDFSQMQSIISAGEKEGKNLVKMLKKEYFKQTL